MVNAAASPLSRFTPYQQEALRRATNGNLDWWDGHSPPQPGQINPETGEIWSNNIPTGDDNGATSAGWGNPFGDPNSPNRGSPPPIPAVSPPAAPGAGPQVSRRETDSGGGGGTKLYIGGGPGAAAAITAGIGAHPVTDPNGNYNAAGQLQSDPKPDEYAAFKAAFEKAVGRPITQAEQDSNAFLYHLSNDLVELLPKPRLTGFDLGRISLLPNDFLLNTLPEMVKYLPNERLVGIPYDTPFGRSGSSPFGYSDLTRLFSAPADASRLSDLARGLGVNTGAAVGANTPGTPPAAATTAPATTGGSLTTPVVAGSAVEEFPATHAAWILSLGAADWARRMRAAGVPWEQITISSLRAATAQAWAARKADPSFDRRIYAAAEKYFLTTGFWPTEIEINKYTQHLSDVPNLSPADGKTAIPKDSGQGSGQGQYKRWELPTTPDGKPVALPPGYEWRFGADGTPVPFDIDQTTKDLFSGWYMDPKAGSWSYNPLLGAADYLQSNDPAWANLVGGFISNSGRLPNREEARTLAMRVWAQADSATRDRASQFAAANGYWPTPFELQWGPSKDTDANAAGTGKAGQAGVGQVPVFVPGIGTVLVNGQSVGVGGATGGGFVFDPFRGIPDNVRPWVREVLNGRIAVTDVPASVSDWANYALASFKSQMPVKRPEDLPGFGTPGPVPGGSPAAAAGTGGGQTYTGAGPSSSGAAAGSAAAAGTGAVASPVIDNALGTGEFLNAYRQIYPGQAAPSADQLRNVGYLNGLDPRVTQFLPSSLMKQLPLETIAKFPNDVLLSKLDLGTIAALPNERLLGLGQYSGSGFDLGVLASLPNERLLGSGQYAGSGLPPDTIAAMPDERLLGLGKYTGSGFSPDDLTRIVTDTKRLDALKAQLPPPPVAPVAAPLPGQVQNSTFGKPTAGEKPITTARPQQPQAAQPLPKAPPSLVPSPETQEQAQETTSSAAVPGLLPPPGITITPADLPAPDQAATLPGKISPAPLPRLMGV